MARLELDRLVELRKQHEEFSRIKYDGHNRHSGITSMRDLNTRRSRRTWNMRMKEAVDNSNSNN